jgi:NADPH2:quinone reductase
MKAIRVHETGGPEKLSYEEIAKPEPGTGQVRVRVYAIGVNYIDVYYRTGLYKMPLPFTPGMEASGIVDALGENVTSLVPGDRVGYAMNPGAYAEFALAKAEQVVKLPDEIDFQTAAAVLLQGMTAHYLAFSTFPLRREETALIHAAAGGVGLLLVQICKMIGAKVIGTVSTPEKAELVRRAGADHVILYEKADFEAEVKRITGEQGVHVVYDSVGRATFDKGLNCLKPRGVMALYGQSSGVVPPIDPGILAAKGSLYLTRTSLAHYVMEREELEWRAGNLMSWLEEGRLEVRIDRRFPLSAAADAHRALEARQTTGKVILLP